MIPDLARHSEKLFYFFEVANEGSLQATARKLGYSAPSLSHAIKQLELVSGAQLFKRNKSGVTLTDAGEKLLVFCRRHFRDLEEVQHSMIHPKQLLKRKIKVGTFQSIALYFWPLLIDSLQNDPHFSLSIKTDRSAAILESLMRREVDISLTVGAMKHERLIKHELYKDEYAFYCSNKWQKSKFNKLEINEHSILYIPDAMDETGHSLRQNIQSWGLKFNDEFELDSFEVVSEFTKNGYGIGILPTKVAKLHVNDIKLIRIEGVESPRFGSHRFILSYRDDLDIPDRLVRKMLDSARRAATSLNS
ncbi:MAG: LysR family transcriptional regulator [Bdellovibrionales bacterium]